MSAHTKHSDTSSGRRGGRRRVSVHVMGMYAADFGVHLLLFFALSELIQHLNRTRPSIPDERAAAAALLAKELSGPRYFQIPEGDLRNADGLAVPTAPEPHISTTAARAQVESIVKARKLNADGEARVRQLIDRLAEQPSSRLVGEEHVNLLRLNLALDALP